jgi:peptide/nickel transport system substrate-binding protein
MRNTKRIAKVAVILMMATALTSIDVDLLQAQDKSVFNISGGNYNPPPVGHRNYFVGGVLPHVHWCLESLTHYFQTNGTYVPGIASDWELSEDYMTFTLTLRQGVKFHDGTELTAKDIVATFYSGLYLFKHRPWYFLENIEVVDDYHLIFHQSEPSDRVMFYALWHYQVVPYSQYGTFSDRVQAKIAEGYDIFTNEEQFQDLATELTDFRPEKAIGTGPYMEAEVTDVEIVLEKFDDFWKGVPPIDEVRLPRVTSADIATTMLLNGEIDWYWGTPTPEVLADLETKAFAQIMKITRPLGPSLYFNHRIYPLSVKEVRQAMAYAINRTELAYIHHPIGGIPEAYQVGGSSFYVPSVLSESFIDQYLEDFAYDYDPAMAEELLQGLEYTKGADGIYVTPDGTRLEFELLSAGNWLSPEATEAVSVMLEQVGIKANVRIIDATAMEASDGPFYLGNYEIAAYFGLASPSFLFEEMFIKYNLVFPGMGFPVMQSIPWLSEPVNVSALRQRMDLFPAEVTQAEMDELYAILTYVCGDQLPKIGLYTRPVIMMVNKQKFTGWPSPEDTLYWGSHASYAAHGRSYLFRWNMIMPLLQLTVSADPSEGGTTSPSPGTYTYAKGETVTFTAEPEAGFTFVKWELDGTEVGTSTTYAVTMDQGHALRAVFSAAPPPYELYAAAIIIVVVVAIIAVIYLRRR